MRFILLIVLVAAVVGASQSKEEERTTYDWGKHTGSTYDWGKHTSTDNGKYTRTTYDWGKHTSTRPPNPTDSSNSTTDSSVQTTTDKNHNDDDDDDHQDQNEHYRCGSGKYSCAGTIGLCIDLTQICDTRVDCPHGDDEAKEVCHFEQSKRKIMNNRNRFSGTGFQFQIRNMKVDKRSKVKLFNQNSDNHSK